MWLFSVCPGGLVSVGVAFGVPCGLDLKSQSLVIESSLSGVRRYLVLGEAFDVSRQAKQVVTVSLAFLRTVFWLSVKFTVFGRFFW